MLENCTDCGVQGRLGNSILRTIRYGEVVNLCWHCTATPYVKRLKRLNGRKPSSKAKRQGDAQKSKSGD